MCLTAGIGAVRLLSVAVLSAAMPFSVWGTSYYVSSSSGNDYNDGLSQQTAWQTLQRVYAKCSSNAPLLPGDNVLLRKGDSWSGELMCAANGTESQPIGIGSYGSGAKPAILGDLAGAIWTPVAKHPGIYQAQIGQGSIIAPVAFWSGVQLRAVPLVGLNLAKPADLDAYLASLPPGSFGPTTITPLLYVHTPDGQPPSDLKCFRAAGISLAGKYLVLEGISVKRSYVGIDVGQSNNITVRSNDVQDTLGIGIYLRGGNTNCLVESNTTAFTGNTAIYILGGAHNIIRSNQISHVTDTILGLSVKADQAGIGLQESNGNLVESNTISNVKSGGIDYYYENGSTVRYNYVYQSGGGIFPHGTNLTIYGNIFNVSWRAGSGIGGGLSASNTGAGTIAIFNNVFYATGAYGMIASSPGSFIAPGSRTADAHAATSGGPVIFRNNIVVGWQPSAFLVQANSGVDSDYNCFFSSTASRFTHFKETYKDLASFQRATGMDTHSYFADPHFSVANPTKPADFHLRTGSPCIASGADLKTLGIFSTDYADFSGAPVPQGPRPNMGAFEGVGQ